MKKKDRDYKTQIRPSINNDALTVLESFIDDSVPEMATLGGVIYILLCESPRFKEKLDDYRVYLYDMSQKV